MKKAFKILSLILVLVLCFSISAFAFTEGTGGINLDDFTPETNTNPGLMNLGKNLIGILQTIAIIVAIAVLIFVGIKYLLASPGEKANIKGSLIPYVIGAVLIFAAVPILGIIQSFTTNLK